MSHTDKGRRWEDRQSWYLLALLTPWTCWMPLVYTGVRTGELAWILWGMFYGLPVFIHMAFNPAEFGVAEWFKLWQIGALIAAVVHSFRARGEYLVLLSGGMPANNTVAQEEPAPADPDERREESGSIELDTPAAETEPLRTAELLRTAAPARAPRARMLLDINRATEQELAMLPGMNEDRARQVIAMRGLVGRFESFDHFAERMSLDQYQREELRPMFMNSEPAVAAAVRIVEPGDSNSPESGAVSRPPGVRIVDL